MISVIIATKGRNNQLSRCIQSIIYNTYSDFEIIILQQNGSTKFLDKTNRRNNKRIINIRLNYSGKTRALNEGIKRAHGEICAFTDDDCIVDREWLKNIHHFFSHNKKITGVFGTVRPYLPDSNNGLFAPSIIFKKRACVVTNAYTIINESLGMGNNMSIRTSVLVGVGFFKSWLGPKGRLGGGGDESELAYRILKKGYVLAHNPEILVYHNRWLNYIQYQKIQSLYSLDTVAYAIYYFLTERDVKILSIVYHRMKTRLFAMYRHVFHQIMYNPVQIRKWHVKEIIFSFLEIIALFFGVIKGVLYALFEGSFL